MLNLYIEPLLILLVRKDQERRKRMVDLNEALIEGMESEPSDATIDNIWEEAINEHNA